MKRIVKKTRIATALLVAACVAACAGAPDAGQSHGGEAPLSAPSAGTIDHVTVPSGALGKPMKAAVYLPPGYNRATRYPVLYLFYGYGGNPDSLLRAPLAINATADRLISTQAIEALIIVVPDYANSFGVNTTPTSAANSAGGSVGPYEDYLIGELLPYIDAHFGTDARRERRYVGGISMGGFAALHLGLRHPALFSKVGAHSAALWDYSPNDQYLSQRDWLYATPQLRARRDPFLLAATTDLRGLRFYLDVGVSDGLRAELEAMFLVLKTVGARAELHSSRGGHNAAYWSSQLAAYLQFYNRAD